MGFIADFKNKEIGKEDIAI